ncbi:hypothetical protein EJB05_42858, partial [Eragrostis curvula]
MALPGCQATCGGVDIPYPFGIGANCSRDEGFEIECSNGTTPVLSLSVEPSVARVRLPIAYQCYDASGYVNWTYASVAFNDKGVYRISDTRNELVVLGCNTLAYITSKPAANSSKTGYDYDVYTGCVSYCTSIESTVDGQCKGVGCCRVDIPPGLTDNSITFGGYTHDHIYQFNPCSFSFLVDRDYYNYSRADLNMTDYKDKMMPVWLDWAIRPSPNATDNTLTCAEAMKNRTSYACKSRNSNCTEVVNGPGYSCHCIDGYEGNPYIDGGCTNINECLNQTKYPCHGHCEDREGYYDCKCPRGSRGNAKQAPCEPIFPRVAQITIGVVCGIAFIIILAISILMVHHKRKLRAFFKRNGGPMLENINNIKIFTKEQLNQITKNYSIVLGKGGFGEAGSIAIACLKEDMEERPNMKQVADNLQMVRREWKQRQGMFGEQVADELERPGRDCAGLPYFSAVPMGLLRSSGGQVAELAAAAMAVQPNRVDPRVLLVVHED